MAKPQIRLKGFEGEWKRHTLEECLSISNERNTNKKFGRENVLSVSDDFGVVNQIKFLGRSYAGADLSGYKVVRPGQVIYTKSPLRLKPFGIIKENHQENGIVSVLYAVFNTSEKLLSSFVDLFFAPSYRTNNYLLPLISKGAKNTINISDENALKGTIYIPIVDEQKDITDYFNTLNSMLQSTTKKIESLKQMKSACLVSMFPQAGETTPRVRFKGFEGEWEVVKLSSIANRVTRKNSHLESTLPLTISAAEGLIEQTSFFNNVVASSNVSGYYLVKNGEFAYNKSYSSGYPFGAVKRLDRYEKGVLSTLYIVFSIDEKVSSDYIVQFFETSLWHQEVAKRAAEGARNHGLLNIGADDFLDIDINLPKRKDEQQQIASFFTYLDKQISLQEQRLEKLKQIKAACLDKMFV